MADFLPPEHVRQVNKLEWPKPCHIGIQWKALAVHPFACFSHFSVFLHHFVLAKSARLRVKPSMLTSAKSSLTIFMIFCRKK